MIINDRFNKNGMIRNKVQLNMNNFTRWITRLHSKSQRRQFQLQENVCDNVSEVPFNYH